MSQRWWARRPLTVVAGILAIARALLAVPVGYLGVLTVAAWVRRPSDDRRRPAGARPVRDPGARPRRGGGDRRRAGALAALDYPAESLDRVHVVADHCTDRTVEIVRAAGVDVRENTSGSGGQGTGAAVAARRGARRRRRDGPPRRRRGHRRRRHGRRARLPRRAGGAPGSWRRRRPGRSTGSAIPAASTATALRRARSRCVTTCAPRADCAGCLERPVRQRDGVRDRGARGAGLDATTSPRTSRLQNELLLDGVLVAYAPDAVVEAAMPTTLEGARTQNERWERGRIELARALRAPARPARRPRRRRPGRRGRRGPRPPRAAAVGARRRDGRRRRREHGCSASLRGRRSTRGWGLVRALVGSPRVRASCCPRRRPPSTGRCCTRPAWSCGSSRLWARMLVRPGAEGWARTARGPTADRGRDRDDRAGAAVLLGTPVDDVTLERVARGRSRRWSHAAAATGRVHQVATVNVDFVVNASADDGLRGDLRGRRPVDPRRDGHRLGRAAPAARRSGSAPPGADLVPALAARAARDGWRLCLFGGAPGVADAPPTCSASRSPGSTSSSWRRRMVGADGTIDAAVVDRAARRRRRRRRRRPREPEAGALDRPPRRGRRGAGLHRHRRHARLPHRGDEAGPAVDAAHRRSSGSTGRSASRAG